MIPIVVVTGMGEHEETNTKAFNVQRSRKSDNYTRDRRIGSMLTHQRPAGALHNGSM